jgi:hypothetical protein
VVALSAEGVRRRRELFARVKPEGRVVVAKGVALPPTRARLLHVDFQAWSIKRRERALAALAVVARAGDPVTVEMVENAAASTLRGKSLDATLALLTRAEALPVT